MPRRRNKGRSRAVREERFERSLDVMNYEMSMKTAESMAKYHEAYVEPLEKRLRTVELFFGVVFVRWCHRKLGYAWHWLYMKFTESELDIEEGGVDPDFDALLQPEKISTKTGENKIKKKGAGPTNSTGYGIKTVPPVYPH